MGTPRSITETTPFHRGNAGVQYPRYKFDYDAQTIWDTKFRRFVVASCKRGGEPNFRLVDTLDTPTHVRVADVFGDVPLDMEVETDFDPRDFADRYDFDLTGDSPVVVCRGNRGAKAGALMKLRSPNGWHHWLLTRNDGKRVYVTPAEVTKAYTRDIWEVPPPAGSKVVTPLFHDYAFTPDGQVWRIRSTTPLLRPEPCPLHKHPDPTSGAKDQGAIYRLFSEVGQEPHYNITRASIKSLFTAS